MDQRTVIGLVSLCWLAACAQDQDRGTEPLEELTLAETVEPTESDGPTESDNDQGTEDPISRIRVDADISGCVAWVADQTDHWSVPCGQAIELPSDITQEDGLVIASSAMSFGSLLPNRPFPAPCR